MAHGTVAIIGGGLAGLAAGIYAQASGFSARIYEQHTQPGGVCTSWRRGAYTIDGCIHWLMGARPGALLHGIYRELGALAGNELLPIHHYARFHAADDPHAPSQDFTADLDRLRADWLALSPADRPVIEALLAGAQAFAELDLDWTAAAPPAGPLTRLRALWAMRRQLRWFGRYGTPIEQFAAGLRDPFLRLQLTHAFVPQMPTFFLMLLLGQLGAGQLAELRDGSGAFAEAIAARFRALGGELLLGADVTRVWEESGRAVGVELAGGGRERADAVISAADGHETLFRLLGGAHTAPEVADRYRRWPLFRPLLMVSFGVARDFGAEPSAHMVRLREPLRAGGTAENHCYIKLYHRHPGFAPAGHTVAQLLVESDFDHWHGLEQRPADYSAAKQAVAAEQLALLDRLYPGIGGQVEMSDVVTPGTFARYTRNHRGAYEGWLITPEAFRTRFDKRVPGLARFYLAGQWVEPGGGVPTVLLSGRQAVRLLCHDRGVAFRTPASG